MATTRSEGASKAEIPSCTYFTKAGLSPTFVQMSVRSVNFATLLLAILATTRAGPVMP